MNELQTVVMGWAVGWAELVLGLVVVMAIPALCLRVARWFLVDADTSAE